MLKELLDDAVPREDQFEQGHQLWRQVSRMCLHLLELADRRLEKVDAED